MKNIDDEKVKGIMLKEEDGKIITGELKGMDILFRGYVNVDGKYEHLFQVLLDEEGASLIGKPVIADYSKMEFRKAVPEMQDLYFDCLGKLAYKS